MNITEVQQWCKGNGVDARMILRGKDFVIRHDSEKLQDSCPSLEDIFYWELFIEGKGYPSSPSDTERLVDGRLTLEEFIRIVNRH